MGARNGTVFLFILIGMCCIFSVYEWNPINSADKKIFIPFTHQPSFIPSCVADGNDYHVLPPCLSLSLALSLSLSKEKVGASHGGSQRSPSNCSWNQITRTSPETNRQFVCQQFACSTNYAPSNGKIWRWGGLMRLTGNCLWPIERVQGGGYQVVEIRAKAATHSDW